MATTITTTALILWGAAFQSKYSETEKLAQNTAKRRLQIGQCNYDIADSDRHDLRATESCASDIKSSAWLSSWWYDGSEKESAFNRSWHWQVAVRLKWSTSLYFTRRFAYNSITAISVGRCFNRTRVYIANLGLSRFDLSASCFQHWELMQFKVVRFSSR